MRWIRRSGPVAAAGTRGRSRAYTPSPGKEGDKAGWIGTTVGVVIGAAALFALFAAG